ncbi:AfsR/SARP family transcriptional regulator [Longimycelium tulufanense]|uniref:AfsR/SARP family transcriptional regulator n=1 Tax=Longimycelium tulufanense TaxID=907463 RepID=UPI00166F3C62|nr:AfsR/SARP family transcriptional regulator [Longimycelium tulufanense]
MPLGPPRQRAVLGILAARANQVVTRDELIDGVWGEERPATAENGVHTYVAGLRQILEPHRARRAPGQLLVSSTAGYVLRLGTDQLDVDVFKQRVRQAHRQHDAGDLVRALESFDAALGLWQGIAFGGVPGPFAEAERNRLDEMRLAATEQRAEVMLGLGRDTEVAAELAGLVIDHPLRERLRGLLMMALYRSGRQAEALKVFQDARQLLVEELGIEPGRDLRRVHEQVLRGDPLLETAGRSPVWSMPSQRNQPVELPGAIALKNGEAAGRASLGRAGAHVLSVPQLQRRLLHSLDGSLGTLEAEFLPFQINAVESTIADFCEQVLLALIKQDNPGEVVRLLGNSIRVGEHVLITKVRPDLQREWALHVAVQDARCPDLDSTRHYSHADVLLDDAVGRYKIVHITVPKSLGPRFPDNVHERVSSMFRAAYSWLGEQVRHALVSLESTFERNALQLFRREFAAYGRNSVAEQVWLVLVTHQRVSYAVDNDVVARALRSARDFPGLQQAPASIASALLANSIPFEKSYSYEAISSRQTIEMSLSAAPYEDVGQDFLLGQGAIYADQMLLTPLATDRRASILAAYPLALRTELSDLLKASKERLRDCLRSTPEPMRPPVVPAPAEGDRGLRRLDVHDVQ